MVGHHDIGLPLVEIVLPQDLQPRGDPPEQSPAPGAPEPATGLLLAERCHGQHAQEIRKGPQQQPGYVHQVLVDLVQDRPRNPFLSGFYR